jgi:hypothetical protein
MRALKERLTVTIDRTLLRAANAAVAAGRADSVSGWVNRALEERAAKEQRLLALAAAVAGYEAKHGAITDEELVMQARADRESARVVRRGAKHKQPTRKRRGRAA